MSLARRDLLDVAVVTALEGFVGWELLQREKIFGTGEASCCLTRGRCTKENPWDATGGRPEVVAPRAVAMADSQGNRDEKLPPVNLFDDDTFVIMHFQQSLFGLQFP